MNYNILNYIYIAFVILRSPLQGTILPIDGRGLILLMLTIFVFILNFQKRMFKNILFSKPLIFWGLWCIYSAFNSYIKGYPSESITYPYFVINQLFCPFVILCISTYEYIKDSGVFIKALLIIFIIYALLGAFVMDIGYVVAEEGILNANTLGNLLALNVVFIIFFASIMFCRKEIEKKNLIVLIIFTMYIVVISATRKALGAGFIMLIALIMSQIKLNFTNLVKILFPILTLYIAINYIMSNTQMGERFQEIKDVNESLNAKYDIEGNIFLEAMGDRAPYYIDGTELFLKNPITGIGLRNFTLKTSHTTHLHTEYMVQLCECGIIGTTLFVLLYITVIKELIWTFKKRKKEINITIIMMGALVAILFLYLTTWSYSFAFYFLILGCLIAHTKKSEQLQNQ